LRSFGHSLSVNHEEAMLVKLNIENFELHRREML